MISTHVSMKNLEKVILKTLKEEWFTESRYATDFMDVKGQELDPLLLHSPSFNSIGRYISVLYEDIEAYRFDRLPDNIGNQLAEEEKNGGLCIYLSVVAYALFQQSGLFHEKNMKLVQGYYSHQAREDNPFAIAMGKNHVGLHAWLLIKNAVFDISIAQEKQFFAFEHEPIIIGKTPKGMLLKGFAEPKKTVNRYIERFARSNKQSPEEWIQMHAEQVQIFAMKALMDSREQQVL